MAITKLPTNYTDDIINTSANSNKKYKLTSVGDNTYLFEDKTLYIQKGTDFGADDVNKISQTVNDMIDAIEEVSEEITQLLKGDIVVGKSEKANTAERAIKADKATTADSVLNDIILLNRQPMTFANKVYTLSNGNITENSLADVYFDESSMPIAEQCDIKVETQNGKVILTASIQPSVALVGTIRVRLV